MYISRKSENILEDYIENKRTPSVVCYCSRPTKTKLNICVLRKSETTIEDFIESQKIFNKCGVSLKSFQ